LGSGQVRTGLGVTSLEDLRENLMFQGLELKSMTTPGQIDESQEQSQDRDDHHEPPETEPRPEEASR
jgi:hypothetical protein